MCQHCLVAFEADTSCQSTTRVRFLYSITTREGTRGSSTHAVLRWLHKNAQIAGCFFSPRSPPSRIIVRSRSAAASCVRFGVHEFSHWGSPPTLEYMVHSDLARPKEQRNVRTGGRRGKGGVLSSADTLILERTPGNKNNWGD